MPVKSKKFQLRVKNDPFKLISPLENEFYYNITGLLKL